MSPLAGTGAPSSRRTECLATAGLEALLVQGANAGRPAEHINSDAGMLVALPCSCSQLSCHHRPGWQDWPCKEYEKCVTTYCVHLLSVATRFAWLMDRAVAK
eukprot:5714289-Heterocapsa_arctica.AAC.1